jgi:divalent metal cation (Fe/Co/Zn/Cd) transporter
METVLRGIRGVVSVHNLHVWSITPGRGVVVVHLAVPGGLTFAQVARVLEEAEEAICGKYDIHHVTIQVEPDLGNLHCQYSDQTAALTDAAPATGPGPHVDVSAGPVAL